MARNKLLPPPMPEPRNPRCTGRTTSIALQLLSKAIAMQGATYAKGYDHHAPGSAESTKLLANRVDALAAALCLQFITVRIVSDSSTNLHEVQVRSGIWED